MSKYEEFIQSIRESRENKYFKYSERHHIVPRCIGGTDDEDNLIYLTYKEHFIAHKLLMEEYPKDRGIILAFHFMCGLKRYDCTPEEYELAKMKFIDSQYGNKYSEGSKHTDEWKLACSNWMQGTKQVLGKVWIHKETGETRMILPESIDEYLLSGWLPGRGNFHTDEVKEYCRRSSEGRMWITDGTSSKMIYVTENIPAGWRKGRAIKQDSKGRIIGSGK